VFVANPRGDRPLASMTAMTLRRAHYPRAAGLGKLAEGGDADGTPDEVFARLDASMLHLDCGLTGDGGLELAGAAVLDAARIADGSPATEGGLAVLPPGAPPELADALLAGRFRDVVRFRGPVTPEVASVIHLVLHAQLVDVGLDPAAAVAAVRRWLADPHRPLPEHLPPWLAARAADPELTDPAIRDALVHHGA
jgi:hypothetical protein